MDETKDKTKKPVFPQAVSAKESEYDNQTVSDRAYMLRPSDDIDSRDAGNPLLVSTYVNETYEHFSESERKYQVKGNYMSNQPYINDRMRCILVDWLVSCLIVSMYHLSD